MPDCANRPKIVVAVLLFKDGRVLLGRRLTSEGAHGMYSTPGGHVEHLESLAGCGGRELAEEVGVEAQNWSLLSVTSVREFAPRHFVVVALRADWLKGEPRNLEPDKCVSWDWYSLDALPSPLTPGTLGALEAVLSGRTLIE